MKIPRVCAGPGRGKKAHTAALSRHPLALIQTRHYSGEPDLKFIDQTLDLKGSLVPCQSHYSGSRRRRVRRVNSRGPRCRVATLGLISLGARVVGNKGEVGWVPRKGTKWRQLLPNFVRFSFVFLNDGKLAQSIWEISEDSPQIRKEIPSNSEKWRGCSVVHK